MASFEYYSMTNEELQQYMNKAIELTAYEMQKDGLISDMNLVTERYLALVVRKGRMAKMFNRLFGEKAEEGEAKITVVRVDNEQPK